MSRIVIVLAILVSVSGCKLLKKNYSEVDAAPDTSDATVDTGDAAADAAPEAAAPHAGDPDAIPTQQEEEHRATVDISTTNYKSELDATETEFRAEK